MKDGNEEGGTIRDGFPDRNFQRGGIQHVSLSPCFMEVLE